MEKKIRFPLSRKIALTIIIVTMIISLFVIAVNYVLIARKAADLYERYMVSIAETVSTHLRTDQIEKWYATGETDDDYAELHDWVKEVGKSFEITWFAILVPESEMVRYIMEVDTVGHMEESLLGETLDGEYARLLCSYFNPSRPERCYFNYMEDYQTLAYPLLTEEGELCAWLFLAIDIAYDHQYMITAAFQLIFIVGIFGILLAVIPVILTSRKVARPIRFLAEGANRLVEEKKNSETTETSIFTEKKVKSKDEVGVLYESLSQMEQDMNAYTRDLMTITAERERIRTELDMAASIQLSQLPGTFPAFPDRTDFRIHAFMQAAKAVGGDFYDFFLVDENHLAMVIADVSGKGIPAALFMMTSKMLIKSHLMEGESPARVLESVSREMLENDAHMFVTVWAAVLDLTTGNGLAVNAGHEHPALRCSGGKFELVQYRHFLPLAVSKKARYEDHEFHLDPGDSLFVYTDGVAEARKPDHGAFYGAERMLDALNRDKEADPEQLIGNVAEDIRAFTGDAEQFDDITMLSLTWYGP